MASQQFGHVDTSGLDVCVTDSLPREITEIETYQQRLDQAYKNLGKLYAKLHWNTAEPVMLPYLNTIAECASAIDRIKRKQADAHNDMFCPACGAHISSSSAFCSHCGQNIQNFLRKAVGATEIPAASAASAPSPAASPAVPASAPAAGMPSTAPGNDQLTDLISSNAASIDDGTTVLGENGQPTADDATTVVGANAPYATVAGAYDPDDPANLTNVIDLIDLDEEK